MKALVVYTSFHHGNTEKIARAIADELKAKLLTAKEVERHMLKDYELIGLGSGIYFWKHHLSLFHLLDHLHEMKHKKVFIFSTSGLKIGAIYHRALRKKLKAKGFKIAGEFNCAGWDTLGPLAKIGGISKGHPNETDIRNAKKFARSIMGGKS